MIQINKFELQVGLVKMITNKKYNRDLAILTIRKMYEFAKVMCFDESARGNKNPRDRSVIGRINSPCIMVFASGDSKKSFSKTRFLSSDPNELCDRLKLLLQEKQVGNNSIIIDEEIVAIAGKVNTIKMHFYETS